MSEEKLKVMLKYEDGYIFSKCQMHTWKDGLKWHQAKNLAKPEGLLPASAIFEEHGYEIVEWDDDVETFED